MPPAARHRVHPDTIAAHVCGAFAVVRQRSRLADLRWRAAQGHAGFDRKYAIGDLDSTRRAFDRMMVGATTAVTVKVRATEVWPLPYTLWQ